MDRSRTLPVGPLDRGRSRLHLTFLALATALAFAAPLAHAHLDAASTAAHGLCGEHLPAGDIPPAADACPICLAGHHAPALHRAVAAESLTPTGTIGLTPGPAVTRATTLARSPATPRAPPRTV